MAYVGAGILTPDEVRANMGLAPLASPSLRGAPATKQSGSHLKKNLRKEDDEDDEDSEDDEDDGTETSSGSSNYNPDEPRIPAGQPGGGQWTTAGNGTSTDSGSISADNIRQALVDRFNNPAPTPQGVQVAGPIVPIFGPTAEIESSEEKKEDASSPEEKEEINEKEEELKTTGQAIATAMASAANTPALNPLITQAGTLLNADNAVINSSKITGYALNPNNEDGKDKAIVFNSVLGYNQSNADSLTQQLQQGVQQYSATPKGIDNYGPRFEVNIPVTGPNGNTAIVTTGWIYDPGSTTPRLTTAYIKTK